MSISDTSQQPKKILIITSSGGGGLIQTANAKEQEIRANHPNSVIVRRDLMKDWMFDWMGRYCINKWNLAQQRGDVAAQTFCVWAQCLAEYLFWPNLFFGTLLTALKEDIDHVIDTQPIGTSPIIRALRIFNWRRKKRVCLQKVLVDLPTKRCTHFFRPIKNLSKKNRPFLRLTTIIPLLEEGQTGEEFWQTNCRLSEKEVQYEDVYVRQSFLKCKGKGRAVDPVTLKVRYKNNEEIQLMRKTFERGSIKATIQEGEVDFQLMPQDRLFTVLLGSQPANEATLNYVKKFAQLVAESGSPKIPTHLFVFCSDHKTGERSLFRRVADFTETMKEYPKHFSIVPFSFQNDDVIAPLFSRSHITCTRSGGQTAMELMCVSNGEIWIHSEAKKDAEGNELSMQELLQGIPGWESANAVYLQKLRGAKIVTPETFAPFARPLL